MTRELGLGPAAGVAAFVSAAGAAALRTDAGLSCWALGAVGGSLTTVVQPWPVFGCGPEGGEGE